MSGEKLRSEFEAWLKNHSPLHSTRRHPKTGVYVDYVEWMWIAWQACAEARGKDAERLDEDVAPPTYTGECLGLDVEDRGDGELIYRLCVEDDDNWHRTDVAFHGVWLGELKQIVERAIAARGEHD